MQSEGKEVPLKIINNSIENKGYIRDATILSLAYGVFYTNKIIKEEGTLPEEISNVTHLDFSEDMENMLDDISEDVLNELYTFMQREEHSKIVRAIKRETEKLMRHMKYVTEGKEVQMLILACYILYHLIHSRTKPIHQNIVDAIDFSKVELIVNTFDAEGFSLRKKIDMNRMAKEIIAY